jgi:4-amino-4-deoxy-L-arabinose transferase-like glycosyltransferase
MREMTERKVGASAGLHKRFGLQTIIFALLILSGVTLRIVNLAGVVNRSPDERTYVWESNEIAEHGKEGLRSLVAQFQRDPSLFTWPSPVRAGYLWILSWMIRVSGHHDPYAGAILSCLASAGALLLVGVIGWRFFHPCVALAALLLYAVSPPVLALARRSWQESFVECLALLLLFVALEAVREKASWWWVIAAGVLAALTLTIKEIAMIHASIVLLLLALALFRQKQWRPLGLLAVSAVISVILCCVWLGYVLGSFSTFLHFTRQNISVAGASAYAKDWQSGSLFNCLTTLWESDPVTFTLGTLGIALALRRVYQSKRLSECHALFWCSLAVLVFFAFLLLLPHHFNLRFLCPAFGPLCLLAGVGVQAVFEILGRLLPGKEGLWTRRFALAVLLCAAFINYRAFQERFVRNDLQDLSLKMLQEGSTGS